VRRREKGNRRRGIRLGRGDSFQNIMIFFFLSPVSIPLDLSDLGLQSNLNLGYTPSYEWEDNGIC
jgi:hypothetical protein